LLSNFIQALYNIADMVIVGNFGGKEGGLAAVNTGGQITMIITSLIVGFAVGGTVLIAQFLGAKREKDIAETIGTLFTGMLYAAVILTVLMIALAYPLVLALGTAPEIVGDTVWYVVICMAGNIFIFGYNGISAVLRGMGDSVRPMVIVAGACVLNIALDLLFVWPMHMGVAGAALATVIAQGAAMIAAIIYLYRKKFVFDFKRKSFKIYKDKLRQLVRVGFPASAQNVVASMSFLILIVLLNFFGPEANGGAGICAKINSIAILPAIAMGMAVASMAGQNIGAGQLKRAGQTAAAGFVYSMIFCSAMFALVSIFPREIVGIFGATPGELEAGVEYLNAFRWDYLIVPLLFVLNGLINGAGHTRVTMFFTLTSSIILRVPLAILFAWTFNLGVSGIGYAVPAATLGTLLFCSVYTLTGKWKENRLLT
jgi:putative MATE family efflux protein